MNLNCCVAKKNRGNTSGVSSKDEDVAASLAAWLIVWMLARRVGEQIDCSVESDS